MDHYPTSPLSAFDSCPYGVPHFVSCSMSLLHSVIQLQREGKVIGAVGENNLVYGQKELTLVDYEVYSIDRAQLQGLFELSLCNLFEILLGSINHWFSGEGWTGHAMLFFDTYQDTLPIHPQEPFLQALSNVSPSTYAAFKRMLQIPRGG